MQFVFYKQFKQTLFDTDYKISKYSNVHPGKK